MNQRRGGEGAIFKSTAHLINKYVCTCVCRVLLCAVCVRAHVCVCVCVCVYVCVWGRMSACVCEIAQGQVYGMQTQLREPREQTQQENPALQAKKLTTG